MRKQYVAKARAQVKLSSHKYAPWKTGWDKRWTPAERIAMIEFDRMRRNPPDWKPEPEPKIPQLRFYLYRG